MTAPFACIFDMNGVIIDDIPYHITAWQQYMQAHGQVIDEEEFKTKINGRTTSDICGLLLGRTPTVEEVRRFEEEKEALYRDIYRPHRKLHAGVEQFLRALTERGIPIAVATSAPPENVSPYILEDLGIRKYFRAVIDASQVRKGKPDPEIYLKAASSIDVDPARCMVFEDSKLGIQAAKSAGMRVVGILTSHSAEELPPVAATAKDFTTLTVSGIEKLMS